MGQEGQQVPPMDDAFVHSVTGRYVELYERLTGQAFLPAPTGDIAARVQRAVETYLGYGWVRALTGGGPSWVNAVGRALRAMAVNDLAKASPMVR